MALLFLQFVDKFMEAKAAAKVLLEERKKAAQKAQDVDKPQPPAGLPVSSPSPVNSPPFTSPPPVSSLPPPQPSPDPVMEREELPSMNGGPFQDIRVNGTSTGEVSHHSYHRPLCSFVCCH